MKYRVFFCFGERPGERPEEFILVGNGALPPGSAGRVALDLLRLNDGAFAEKYDLTRVYDGDGAALAYGEPPVWVVLDEEKAHLAAFVETVLLKPPRKWQAPAPPGERMTLFEKLRPGANPIVEKRFASLRMVPASALVGERRPRRRGIFAYETDDLLAVAWLELFTMAERNVVVKECKGCGMFFVPQPANALHCVECKEPHVRQEFYRARKREEMSEDEIVAARKWRREYMRKYRKERRY